MSYTFKSPAVFNTVVLAALLATAGAAAVAQPAPLAPSAPAAMAPGARPAGGMDGRMGWHDPAKMQAMMAKRQAAMKTTLKITPAQEGAWTSYTTAMQPPANGMRARPTPEQRAEMDKLTTPERIDKMRTQRTQRMADMSAAMNQRGDATKALYAALSPEQQKVFDAEQKKHGGMHGRHHGGHRG